MRSKTKKKKTRNMEHANKHTTNQTDCLQKYKKVRKLGQGTFGAVYHCRDTTQHNRNVAIKKCALPRSNDLSVTVLRELQHLRVLRHCPYIVSLLEVHYTVDSLYLVLDYCPYCLSDVIDTHYQRHQRSPFSLVVSKTLCHQLLQALHYIHSYNLLHRDIKMSNLLYTNGGRLQVGDFGSSRPYDGSTMTPQVASLWYRPPEVLLLDTAEVSSYGWSMDLWAAGCVFVEFLTGYPALPGRSEPHQLELILQQVGLPARSDQDKHSTLKTVLPKVAPTTTTTTGRPFQLLDTLSLSSLSNAGCDLIVGLLQWEPAQRWTAAHALDAPFFRHAPLPLPPSSMPRRF